MPTLSKLEQQALNTLRANETKYAKQIQEQLASALKSIYGDMTKIYQKWAKNGKLTKAEMTAYNKYSTMEKQILAQLDPALKANIKTIKKLLPEQYQESFFHYAWAMDNATGLRLSWGNVNTKANLALFDITNPKNIEMMNALKNYTLSGKKFIRSALLNGLTLGKTYPQMARDLKAALDKTTYEAMRIVRTEGQRAQNKGQFDSYLVAQNNGIEGKRVWSATLDIRTRPDHAAMDGVSPDPKTGLYTLPDGETALYPGDPNLSAAEAIHCRCRERFEIEGYSPQLMRTREEGVLPFQNYNDYVDNYHPDWKRKK